MTKATFVVGLSVAICEIFTIEICKTLGLTIRMGQRQM